MNPLLTIAPELAAAQTEGLPLVALESTLITHGLPWPLNFETALEAEAAVRAEGAVPATIALLAGRPTVGLDRQALEGLARSDSAAKASRRDLAAAIAQQRTASTTVAATMFLARLAGIRLFATGGIGGVHRGGSRTLDVSADLLELSRSPVAVVSAGAKSILDIPLTLEVLETQGVPVIGYRTGIFPGFYTIATSEAIESRIESAQEAAGILRLHWQLGGRGILLVQPPPAELALDPAELDWALGQAEAEAAAMGVKGKKVTPYLLERLAAHTGGRSLAVNQALVVANARLAAQISRELTAVEGQETP